MDSQTSELVELKFHEAIEKLQALRRMCEASGQPFYVEILDETIPVFAREYNAQINERLSSSEVTEEWLPIETAPKDGTKILAHWYGNNMPFITVIWWRGDKYPDSYFPWRTAHDDSAIGGYGQCHLPKHERTWRQGPTHWMPLPDPPQTKDGPNHD